MFGLTAKCMPTFDFVKNKKEKCSSHLDSDGEFVQITKLNLM